ncbi:MAG: NAD-glutamate dehydrogenase, partial [Streptosporangiaceae bacterium]
MSESTGERWPDPVSAAADLAGAVPGVGDVPGYLHAYYRHVPGDELADPRRLVTVAAGHAQLAAQRPPGQAIVGVRAGDDSVLEPGSDVIDVVTDDMPFLVDSITMELSRHGLSARVIVHPQLRVRRTAAGAIIEVPGLVNGVPLSELADDEFAESWMHIEIAQLADSEAKILRDDLQRVLGDVRVAVQDADRMRARAVSLAQTLGREGCDILVGGEPGADGEPDAETAALLSWLAEGRFTFLGYREYDLREGADGLALRAVAGTGLGILRHDKPDPGSAGVLPPETAALARDPERLVVTKANSRSSVHRPSFLDYIAVKRVDLTGTVTGEYRFLGLYTHMAFTESITAIPVARRKLDGVLDVLGLAAGSHDGTYVAEVLESYPREELFMTSVADLAQVAAGVLQLRERRQTRLFLRRDVYGRYISCLVYLPRDRYTTQVRLRAQEILRRGLTGAQVDYSVFVGESPVARLHIVLRAERGQPLPEMNTATLERAVAAAARSWDDDLAVEAPRSYGEQGGRALLAMVGDAIPESYKTDVPAAAACGDLAKIMHLRESGEDVAFELWESQDYVGGVPLEDGSPVPEGGAAGGGAGRVWRLTIYRTGAPITLTDVLPRLQHMGVDVVDEHPYEFHAAEPFWIYDFGLRRSAADAPRAGADGRIEAVRHNAESALGALWRGVIEDDGFNALVLDANLSWSQTAVLRAYAKYLRQAGTTFSQDYIEQVLRSNPTVTRLLVRLFESRFDPQHQTAELERTEAIAEEIRGELDEVASLDEDRILRTYWQLIGATLRTNYFAGAFTEVPYLVVKLDAAQVPDLPAPRPKFELFVYSPRFEGVHLRFADVARGGLRWSDRREDFRTEVLGLAKAQEVKNSVIVPSGAKGGFVCKQLPDPADREAHQGEVLACYRMFISAMLDVTDNLEAGRVIPPSRVVRHDGDDPYLVVAADKGTATFSDTANEIASARGYWLGDAFASGGSEGYDHKKMGITARGGWESVRFHFQTLGINVDADDFTVAGIGDMSGDVFGNGMLLSRHIRLVAAFDHRHVFMDPDPDPGVTFAERQRLFDLPRSSWADYDLSLISAGGGVWPRSAKSVPISPQARTALGLADEVHALSPDQLISAILAAPVDLLWNGGIGTYVKGTTQSSADVGDRSSDAVRVNATELRARVVGEGGNLGLTQAGRIEYALAGGLVNTDFIDNSAGVDCSDHEVNLKVLLDLAVRRGELSGTERDALLVAVTGEVVEHVLYD